MLSRFALLALAAMIAAVSAVPGVAAQGGSPFSGQVVLSSVSEGDCDSGRGFEARAIEVSAREPVLRSDPAVVVSKACYAGSWEDNHWSGSDLLVYFNGPTYGWFYWSGGNHRGPTWASSYCYLGVASGFAWLGADCIDGSGPGMLLARV